LRETKKKDLQITKKRRVGGGKNVPIAYSFFAGLLMGVEGAGPMYQ
jgi:hypothetical protein